MKKWILLLVLVFAVFVAFNRTKLFVRDPLASVTRDGVRETGTQVFINFNNEVLLEHDGAPAYVTAAEAAGHVGTPQSIQCVHWLACLTDAYPATLVDGSAATRTLRADGKAMEFRDAAGRDVLVALR